MISSMRSEVLKIRTTAVWWSFLLAVLAATGIAAAINRFGAAQALEAAPPPDVRELDPESARQVLADHALSLNLDHAAASLYTSGQFLGLLFAFIIGALGVTNEFRHQTATPTFLMVPRRAQVIAAKIGAAMFWGLAFGVVSTVLSIAVGVQLFASHGAGTRLTDPDVLTAIGLNLLAYALWAVFGVGLGTLLKSQIAAITTGVVLYFIAETGVAIALTLLGDEFDQQWLADAAYFLPSGASGAMTAAVQVPGTPVWWVGALTLVGYGLLSGAAGSALTARRDIT